MKKSLGIAIIFILCAHNSVAISYKQQCSELQRRTTVAGAIATCCGLLTTTFTEHMYQVMSDHSHLHPDDQTLYWTTLGVVTSGIFSVVSGGICGYNAARLCLLQWRYRESDSAV